MLVWCLFSSHRKFAAEAMNVSIDVAPRYNVSSEIK
jgi:hypothetical protein